MRLSREELLRQKALVEEQLRWIETKLEEDSPAGGSPPMVPKATPQTQSVRSENAEANESRRPDTGSSSFELIAGSTAVDYVGNGPAEGITTGQKVGCLVLFVVVCLGALATLFVLPYLLY